MTICSASCQAACAIEAQGRELLGMYFPPGPKTQQSRAGSATLGDGIGIVQETATRGVWGAAGGQLLLCHSCTGASVEPLQPHFWGCTSPWTVQGANTAGTSPQSSTVSLSQPQGHEPISPVPCQGLLPKSTFLQLAAPGVRDKMSPNERA